MLVFALSLANAAAPPPIVNGSKTSDYPQVITLVSVDSRGNGYNFCSGTLIAEKWVVTAGHCADAFEDNERMGLGEHWAYVGYDLDSGAGITDGAQVKDWYQYSKWDGETYYYDIALVELKTRITSIDPMPVNKNSIRSTMVGEDYRYVGWGITSDNATDSSKKRTADIPLYDYDNYLQYGYDPVDGQNVCSGDSGGAVLEIIADGEYELSAVNSFVYAMKAGDDPCADGATGGVRVDQYISWIEGYTPVYNYSEMYGDADTDTDTDTDADADTDTDTDTDTDADTDADADTDSDTDADSGGDAPFDDPAKPSEVGEDYISITPGICGIADPSGLAACAAALALVVRRRR